MWLFKSKPKTRPLITIPPATSRVEIELHKNASVQAAKRAERINEHLNALLIENGFTLKIALAAGAQLRQADKVASK